MTVEDAKCVQANAFVKTEIFEEFFLKPSAEVEDEEGSGDLSFAVNLSVVLECLQMLSGDQPSHTVKLCYLGFGHSLEILMEEDGVISDSQIKTSEADENLDFNFANAKIVSKIIMHSSYLKEVFSELDNSSDHIEFIINPSDETFRVRTIGPAGECEISVPSSSDMVEHFNCTNVSKARFNLSLLRNGLKPLAFSDKVVTKVSKTLQRNCMLPEGEHPDGREGVPLPAVHGEHGQRPHLPRVLLRAGGRHCLVYEERGTLRDWL